MKKFISILVVLLTMSITMVGQTKSLESYQLQMIEGDGTLGEIHKIQRIIQIRYDENVVMVIGTDELYNLKDMVDRYWDYDDNGRFYVTKIYNSKDRKGNECFILITYKKEIDQTSVAIAYEQFETGWIYFCVPLRDDFY